MATETAVTVAAPIQARVIATWMSVAIYLMFCGVVLLNAVARPVANWDALAYVASVVRHQGETRPAVIHENAYGAVARAVTPDQMQNLREGNAYRRAQAADPAAFVSMLPMYEVKGGYIWLVSALSRLADPVSVMRALSLAATLAMLATLLLALWRIGALHLAGLVVPPLAALQVIDLASISTPDPLVAALSVGATALIVTGRSARPPLASLVLLLLAVAIRPDMLVATTGLPVALVAGCGCAAWLEGNRPGSALKAAFRTVGLAPWLAALAGFGIYLVAKAGVAHPGWWAHFNFTFVTQQENMTGFAPAFEWRIYVSAVARAILRLLRDETWSWIALAIALSAVLFMRIRDLGPVLIGLVIFVIWNLAARMIAFPLPDARIATPILITLLMVAGAYLVRPARPVPTQQPVQRAS